MPRVATTLNWLLLVAGLITAVCCFVRAFTGPEVSRELVGGCVVLLIALDCGLDLWLDSRSSSRNRPGGAQRQLYR